MPKIKIDKELYLKAKQFTAKEGYSSVDECVATLLERAIDQMDGEDNDEDVLKRIKGLGYIS